MGKDVDKTGAGAPAKSTSSEVEAFAAKMAAMARTQPAGARGRLIFAIDATASRQPSWDQAVQVQSEMFAATASLGGLDVQLVYFRGIGECRASPWIADSKDLVRRMTGMVCLGGRTQIGRALGHCLAEAKRKKVNAVVYVGDCMEEDVDPLAAQAGELGILGVPLFVFHEGGDPVARTAFEQFARLSGGAYCPFDANSSDTLRRLLSAVAVYAAGGSAALNRLAAREGGEVLRLTQQMRRR
jgi:hypothetical protein